MRDDTVFILGDFSNPEIARTYFYVKKSQLHLKKTRQSRESSHCWNDEKSDSEDEDVIIV